MQSLWREGSFERRANETSFDPTFERYIELRRYALAKLAEMRAARDAINIPLLSRSVLRPSAAPAPA